MLVTMVHPWRGERDVHRKAAPKYERNGWRYKTDMEAEFFLAGAAAKEASAEPEPVPDSPDPPKRRRRPKPKPDDTPTEPSETDSEGFSMPEHEEGSS